MSDVSLQKTGIDVIILADFPGVRRFQEFTIETKSAPAVVVAIGHISVIAPNQASVIQERMA